MLHVRDVADLSPEIAWNLGWTARRNGSGYQKVRRRTYKEIALSVAIKDNALLFKLICAGRSSLSTQSTFKF